MDWSGFLGRDIRISVYKYGALQDGESPYTIIVARHDQPHTDHTHENKLKYLHKIRVKRYERTIDFTEDEKYHIDRAFTRGFGERKRQVCNETPYARFPATSVVYED